MHYCLQRPPNDDPTQSFALWLVLHGAFAQAEQALTLFGREAEERDAFLLAPQASRPCGDGYCLSFAHDAVAIRELMDSLRAQYSIDSDRIILIGYSMGCTMGCWLLAQNPTTFAWFAALAMGSAFERWEQDDGGIDELGLKQSAARTRVVLAVDQRDPAGPNDYFEANLTRLRQVGFDVVTVRPSEGTHAVTPIMKLDVLRMLSE